MASGILLGYTRTGKPVFEPTRGAPDTNAITAFHRTKAKFPGWSKADHMDAEQLLLERGEQLTRSGSAADRTRGSRCTRWASVHWDIGGRWTSS